MEAFTLQVQEVPKISPVGLLRAFHLWFKAVIIGGQKRKLEKLCPGNTLFESTQASFSLFQDKAIKIQWGYRKGRNKGKTLHNNYLT